MLLTFFQQLRWTLRTCSSDLKHQVLLSVPQTTEGSLWNLFQSSSRKGPCSDVQNDNINNRAICGITEPTDWFINHRMRPITPVSLRCTVITRRQDGGELNYQEDKVSICAVKHISQQSSLTFYLILLLAPGRFSAQHALSHNAEQLR